MQALFAFLLASCLAVQQHRALVIVADDMGWDSYGKLTPHLVELASKGVTFTRAYSWPVCSTSRYAAMFGEYPRCASTLVGSGTPIIFAEAGGGIGDLPFNAFLTPDAATISERIPLTAFSIAEAIPSSALVGKWHLGRAPLRGSLDQIASGPFAQGWTEWRAGTPGIQTQPGPQWGHFHWQSVQQGLIATANTYTADAQRDQTISMLQRPEPPRLIWLNFNVPHEPEETPPGMADQPTDRQDYEQVVSYMDAQIGAILDAVDLETTFVIFFGDNGPSEATRPLGVPPSHAKGTLFELGINVPLIVVGPGVTQGTTSDRLVSLVDIPATLLELLGECPAPFPHSQSFADDLGTWSGTQPRDFVMSERYEVGSGGAGVVPVGWDAVTIVERNWKVVVQDADGSGPGGFTATYYHLPDEEALVPSQSVQDRLQAELAGLPPRHP